LIASDCVIDRGLSPDNADIAGERPGPASPHSLAEFFEALLPWLCGAAGADAYLLKFGILYRRVGSGAMARP
jgi:hypothetical protein